MSYIFKWKEPNHWFWRKQKVVGHNLDQTGHMTLFFDGEKLETIPNWKDCRVQLGPDWFVHQKKVMEEQSGQTIK